MRRREVENENGNRLLYYEFDSDDASGDSDGGERPDERQGGDEPADREGT